MKYTEITPDQIYEIINEVVNDNEFKESVKESELSKNEIIDGIEDLFYELTREEGFSFRGMKNNDKFVFKGVLRMIIRTNIELSLTQ